MGCSGDAALPVENSKKLDELIARQELKALVDSYANESDRNNQDFYVNVFTEDCHVRVYFNNKLYGFKKCSWLN